MFRVPGIVRPQLTLKYLLLSSTILYVSYCFLFNVPLASSSLPPYTGPYDVGTIDVEVPCTPRKTSDATFKATGLPAFQVCQGHAYASLLSHFGILTCQRRCLAGNGPLFNLLPCPLGPHQQFFSQQDLYFRCFVIRWQPSHSCQSRRSSSHHYGRLSGQWYGRQWPLTIISSRNFFTWLRFLENGLYSVLC